MNITDTQTQIIIDAIKRSISYTERVHIEVEDLHAAIAAAREAWEGEVDYTDENGGALDVWGTPVGEPDTDRMAWRLRVIQAPRPANADEISWQVPPENQGQIVEVSYGQDDELGCWERTLDRSDRSVSYRYLGSMVERDLGTWEPWQSVPECAR